MTVATRGTRAGGVVSPPAARWVMWGIPLVLFFIGFLHRVAPGVLAKELMQAFGASGAIVGLLSATYFYAYGDTRPDVFPAAPRRATPP